MDSTLSPEEKLITEKPIQIAIKQYFRRLLNFLLWAIISFIGWFFGFFMIVQSSNGVMVATFLALIIMVSAFATALYIDAKRIKD